MYRLPTGGGKTVIFTHLAQEYVSQGKRVLILTHRRTLVRQTAKKIREEGLKYGVISSDHIETLYDNIQIASIQTLSRPNRLGRIGKFYNQHFDLVVVDEAHHTTSQSFIKVIAEFCFNGGALLGVSATPQRLDGAKLNPPV